MALLTKSSNGWTFTGKNCRHKNKALEKTAEEDPSYLTFLWTKSLAYLNEEAIDALDEVMERRSIPKVLKKKSKKGK